MIARVFCLVLALFAVALPCRAQTAPDAGAPAQPTDPATRAQQLKQQGDAAMTDLRYADALDLYQQAAAIAPSPALLYNQGRALEALGRFPEALHFLERFNKEAPPDLKARVPRLEELITGIRNKVGVLTITCNVKGARIIVNGQISGTAPLEHALELNAGTVKVEIDASGYRPYRSSIAVPGGGSAVVNATLVSKQSTGFVRITSPVAGALVRVDGKRIGTVPVELVLERGRHKVELSKDGYENGTSSVVIMAGQKKELSVPLASEPGLLSRWYFWTAVGVVVVGGAVATAALLTERSADRGDIPPGQISGPLVRF